MKTSSTLKGHGVDYYINKCTSLFPVIIEICKNREVYSKKYIEQIQSTYEQNRTVCLAYKIVNGNTRLNA